MRRLVAAVGIAAVLAGTVACSGPGSLPEGVAVSVYQTRSDVPANKLEIQVRNRSGSPITVSRATFASPLFDGEAVWNRDAQVPAGQVVDLKVQLPEVSCTPGVRPDPTVTLDYRTTDGEAHRATVATTDPLDQLPGIAAEQCLQRAVARVVTIEPRLRTPAPVGPAEVIGSAREQILLDVSLVPTSAPGTVTFRRAFPTTLLAPADVSGRVLDDRPLDATVGEGSPTARIELRFVPARCDLHALADDKRGTIMPFEVSLSSGESGRISVALPEAVKAQVFARILRICRSLPGS